MSSRNFYCSLYKYFNNRKVFKILCVNLNKKMEMTVAGQNLTKKQGVIYSCISY